MSKIDKIVTTTKILNMFNEMNTEYCSANLTKVKKDGECFVTFKFPPCGAKMRGDGMSYESMEWLRNQFHQIVLHGLENCDELPFNMKVVRSENAEIAFSKGTGLKSLKNFPKVIGTLDLSNCTELKSFENCDIEEIDVMEISNCGIESLKNIPYTRFIKFDAESIKRLKDVDDLDAGEFFKCRAVLIAGRYEYGPHSFIENFKNKTLDGVDYE